MTRDELDALNPDAFLNPSNFVTLYDHWSANATYAKEQYTTGVTTGLRAQSISIACNGVWSARLKDDGRLESHEVIGYHACTADLLRGFLDSGVPIKVYRLHCGAQWITGVHA